MSKILKSFLTEALQALQPGCLVSDIVRRNELQIDGQQISLSGDFPVYLIATGKASLEMGGAVENKLTDRLARGLTVTYLVDEEFKAEHMEFYRGSHPVPDEHSLQAGEALKAFAENIPANSLVINCLSGGTSSLVCLPAEGISIEELNKTYELLNNCGANIREINTVRKHLSAIKGGQLLRYFHPSVTLIDLIISDVPDDDPAIIGSGPTTVDISTFADVKRVFGTYEIWNELPTSVRKHIAKGLQGLVQETLKPGDDPLKDHQTFIIGSARKLALKVKELAENKGYCVWIADQAYNSDVGDVTSMIAQHAIDVANGRASMRLPALLIYYGESTVNVTGTGKGGRNQELALLAAREMEGSERITWMSVGTDGIDGPTDAAGAVIDGSTISQAKDKGLDPDAYIRNNDAYHFHKQAGTLLKTGPTGNNLMDLQMVLIE